MMRLRYIGPFACPTGYGRAGHDYLAALHRAGVELDIVPIHDADPSDLEQRYHHLLPFVHRDGFEPSHVLVHTIPRYAHEFVTTDLDPGPDVKRICMTTWETDALPSDIAELLDEYFDLVIVPCQQNAHAFRCPSRGHYASRDAVAGLPAEKVAVVPHCFDADWWWQRPAMRAPLGTLVYYSISAWAGRKNPLGLLKAYLATFRSSDDVMLRLVCPNPDRQAIASLVARMGLTDLPKFEVITKRLTEDELFDLHASSHVYVSASRGEAWGLGSFEAALLDNVVVCPGFGGPRAYLEAYPRWRQVAHFMTPAIADEEQIAEPLEVGGMRIVPVTVNAPTGISADQHWAEPDLASLQFWMHHWAKYRTMTISTAREHQDSLKQFTYEAVGPLLRDTLANVEARHGHRDRDERDAGTGSEGRERERPAAGEGGTAIAGETDDAPGGRDERGSP